MRQLSAMIALLIFSIFGCSKAPLPTENENIPIPPIETATTLKITAIQENSAELDSASVFLNGDFIGLTPLEYRLEKQGTFAIRVQKQQFLIYGQSITTRGNESVYVEAVLNRIPANKGQLLITVSPDSCEIAIRGDDGGTIQQTIGNELSVVLPSAGYFVVVSKSGFKSLNLATKVLEDSITIENLKLEPIPREDAPLVELALSDSAKINQPVLVQWRTQRATRVDVDYVTNPGLNGKREITFRTPGKRVITVTAYNSRSAATISDTVEIFTELPPQPAAPNITLEISPKVTQVGQPVQIRWQTDGNYVIIDHGIGTRGIAGTEEIAFDTPGTKIITAVAYSKENRVTTIQDSVYVRQGTGPRLPAVTISVSDSAQVGQPVNIEWHAEDATHIDIDYLGRVGLNGKSEITFDTPGMRILTANAYNVAGRTTAQDTVIIYEKAAPPPPVIPPLEVLSGSVICAEHAGIGPVDEEAAIVPIQIAGYYRVMAEVDYNSGDSQKNESFFLAVKNADNALQWPRDPNAGPFKVVADDPGPKHIIFRDGGLFYFSTGTNNIQFHHYSTIADQYPQFVVEGPITGTQSVKIIRFRLEYVVGE